MEDAEIIASADVHKMILDNFGELHKMNKLNGIEKIKKIHLISEPFTQENDILTPTFKIKRNIARNVYKEKIDEIYKAGLWFWNIWLMTNQRCEIKQLERKLGQILSKYFKNKGELILKEMC